MFLSGYGVVIYFCKVEFFYHPKQGGGVFGQDDGDVEGGGVVDAEFLEKGDVEVWVLRIVDVGVGLGIQGDCCHEEEGEYDVLFHGMRFLWLGIILL